MSRDTTIFSIEAAPGDVPLGVEQPNGDLLVPAGARPIIEQALLEVELAFFADLETELPALKEVRLLLGIEKPQAKNAWHTNLYRVRPL
jgi:hypothetical protein